MVDQSLRGYLSRLDAAGRLERITQSVDVDQNVSALSWQTYVERRRACLFTDVIGFPGWQVASQLAMDRDMWATALEVAIDEVMPTLAARLAAPIAPCLVEDAPVHEVIEIGDAVDLMRLPAMWTSERDPGRYIASGMGIIKNPDSGVRNMSVHRAQVFDRNSTGYYMLPRQAMRIHQMYERHGRPMQAALVIGGHPLLMFAAAFVAPFGVDELAVAGGLLGEPVRLVKCRTIDLEVPADAELVLEGEILPGDIADEGPFGEVTGTYSKRGTVPVFRVKAITRRRAPIFYAMSCGMAPSDAHAITCAVVEAKLWDHLRAVDGGLLDIRDIRCPGGMSPLMVAVRMQPHRAGQVASALLAAAASPYLHPKFLVGLDAEVDAGDAWAVLRSLVSRLDPQRGITRIDRTRVFTLDNASPLDPGQSPMNRVGTKVLFDATLPLALDAQARAGHQWLPAPAARTREQWLSALGVSPRAGILELAGRVEKHDTARAGRVGRARHRSMAESGVARPQAAAEARVALHPVQPVLPSVPAILEMPASTPEGEAMLFLVRLVHDTQGLRVLVDTPRLAACLARGRPVRLLGGLTPAQLLAAACGTLGRDAGWSLGDALAGEVGVESSRGAPMGGERADALACGHLGPLSADRTNHAAGLTGFADVPLQAIEFMQDDRGAGRSGSASDPASLFARLHSQAIDTAALVCLAHEVLTAHHLRNIEGGLDLRDVVCPVEAGGLLTVLQMAPRVAGQATTALMAALSGPSLLARCAIAVDPDVNPHDPAELIWALASRTHAPDDLTVLGESAIVPSGPHAVSVGPGSAVACKWLCDCTVPLARVSSEGVEAFARATPRNNATVELSRFSPPRP
jgi:UbiD family decarboxylase